MTMAAACRFANGGVVVADSRATWYGGGPTTYADALQKIALLTPRIAITYAGDVEVAATVIADLASRVQRDERLRVPDRLCLELPRVARHIREEHEVNRAVGYVGFLLAAVDGDGSVRLWRSESPQFDADEINGSCAVIGSGEVVELSLIHI